MERHNLRPRIRKDTLPSIQEVGSPQSPFYVEPLGHLVPLCSGDGLVLLQSLVDIKTFVLWNPSIRKHTILSCPYACPYEEPHKQKGHLYGVYYNSQLDDYKVIIMTRGCSYTVYSLKTNSWAEKKSFPFKESSCGRKCNVGGIRAKGGVYWKLSYYNSSWEPSTGIVCFDTFCEEFKDIPFPHCGVHCVGFMTCYRGRLTLSCINYRSSETHISNLPCDIILNILSKLPVKSLLRFRCVSKPWDSTISDPEFAKTHFHQSKKLDRHIVLQRRTINYCNSSLVEYFQYSNFPIEHQQFYAEPLCSGDGLVLLQSKVDSQKFVLWNPSIRKHTILSCPYAESTIHRRHLCGVYYNSQLDDYKVIIRTKGCSYTVYSLKKNSWAEKKSFPFKASWCHREFNVGGIGAKGGVYWKLIYCNPSGEISSRIICFDTICEEFKDIPLPNCEVKDVGFMTCYRGRLTVSCTTYGSFEKQICTLKHKDERESWVKLRGNQVRWLNLSDTNYFRKGRQSGEALLQGDSGIFFANMSDHKDDKYRGETLINYVHPIMLPCLDSLYFPIAGISTVKGGISK